MSPGPIYYRDRGGPPATATSLGTIQLAGDLGGVAVAPTVPGLASKSDVGHTHAQSDVSGLVGDLADRQLNIEWQDEGVGTGSAGSAEVVNFTGAGVTAVEAAGTLTVTIPQAGAMSMGEISITDNTTATVISTGDTATLFDETTSLNVNEDFDSPSAGRLRYIGTDTKMVHCGCTISVKGVGANDVFEAVLIKNATVNGSNEYSTGTILTQEQTVQKLGAVGDVASTAIHVMVEMATNDYLELFVKNVSDTDNVTVTDMNLFAVGMPSSSAQISNGDKGDITVSGSGNTWTIDNAAVTYAKIQDVSAASRLLGRGSASGSGDAEEITISTGLSMSGTVLSAAPPATKSFTSIGLERMMTTANVAQSQRGIVNAFHLPTGGKFRYITYRVGTVQAASPDGCLAIFNYNGTTKLWYMDSLDFAPAAGGTGQKIIDYGSVTTLAPGSYLLYWGVKDATMGIFCFSATGVNMIPRCHHALTTADGSVSPSSITIASLYATNNLSNIGAFHFYDDTDE